MKFDFYFMMTFLAHAAKIELAFNVLKIFAGIRNGQILWLTPNWLKVLKSLAGSVCGFLEQETFTPQKYW